MLMPPRVALTQALHINQDTRVAPPFVAPGAEIMDTGRLQYR